MSMLAGPLNRSRKESGRSVSSAKLFCAHSLRVITMLTILKTTRQKVLLWLYPAKTFTLVLFYGHAVNSPLSSENQLSYLDRAPRARKEFWEPASLLSMAAICCSSEEVSSHIDCPLCIHAHTKHITHKPCNSANSV